MVTLMEWRVKQKILWIWRQKLQVNHKEEESRLDSNFCTMTMKYLVILRERKCNPGVLQIDCLYIQRTSSLRKKKYLGLKFGKVGHIPKK